ncbi:helix-turn-helix domain-containing protein [Porticoccus litoralis]|jgi:transcriptional regulator with XRE-family HTH domain|uniref:Helix-turn-helix transcriptional regulator n=1 Tax=Porticoccus litoralis TaxID=434086 RepID=A0AAW8BA73_9GAMM|nr:helix-turn-helix transcriptional regulator [Porticoccus litoralis]MDP1521495.1 helix-turn-helix transcriptional regulator [Porticoccus litoralis]
MTFSRVLKEIRQSKGYSQEHLAFEAGLSMRSISLLEGNKQQPTITTIENLSKALGITMVEFIQAVEVGVH